MEEHMWQHPATQANLELLRQRGAFIVGPLSGHLASGASGVGRMAEPDDLLGAARYLLGRSGTLAGRRVVITAGGTHEALDPVRFIGNRSSGKMGVALAEAALDLGADVTLIHGPLAVSIPWGVQTLAVESAQQMCDAVLAQQASTDVLIGAAAVADFRPAAVAAQRAVSGRPLLTVGFAAETENLHANAQAKLAAKGLALIVANDVTASDAGFGVDTNRVTLLTPDSPPEALPLLSKAAVAAQIMQRVVKLLLGPL